MINLFTYGMSGSGKDTISNYFQDAHLYLKFRCAGTMKQILCEKGQVTFSKLEELKRKDERVRKEHWVVGDWLGADGASVKQRLLNIIGRDSVEFDMMPKSAKNNPIIICDVRRLFEAETLLENGFVGIFLSRTNSEYKPGKHSTEIDMFYNGMLVELVNKYPKQCIVIYNDREDKLTDEMKSIKKIGEKYTNALNVVFCPNENDGDILVNAFKENLTDLIPMFFGAKEE